MATLILAALACAFAALGWWQLQRADLKRDLMTAHREAPELPLQQALEEQRRYARVTLDGVLDPRHLLLENQVLNGQPGLHVFTPLVHDGGAILVNRGWLPYANQRRGLPQIPTPEGTVTVTGRINLPPRPGMMLGQADVLKDQWPQRITYLQLEAAATALELPLADQVLQLDADAATGFAGRDWPAVNFGPKKHIAYALQWFTLVLTVLVVWIILGVLRARN